MRITVSQPLIAVGNTHASSVMAAVRSSELESLTVTQSLTPSNDSALPYLPLVVQVAPEIVPVFPLPEVSASVEPVPASKLYAATSVFELDTVTLLPADGVPRLPLSSTARLLMTAGPLRSASRCSSRRRGRWPGAR